MTKTDLFPHVRATLQNIQVKDPSEAEKVIATANAQAQAAAAKLAVRQSRVVMTAIDEPDFVRQLDGNPDKLLAEAGIDLNKSPEALENEITLHAHVSGRLHSLVLGPADEEFAMQDFCLEQMPRVLESYENLWQGKAREWLPDPDTLQATVAALPEALARDQIAQLPALIAEDPQELQFMFTLPLRSIGAVADEKTRTQLCVELIDAVKDVGMARQGGVAYQAGLFADRHPLEAERMFGLLCAMARVSTPSQARCTAGLIASGLATRFEGKDLPLVASQERSLQEMYRQPAGKLSLVGVYGLRDRLQFADREERASLLEPLAERSVQFILPQEGLEEAGPALRDVLEEHGYGDCTFVRTLRAWQAQRD